MEVLCSMCDEFGNCGEPSIGHTSRGTVCARHAFILQLSLELFDQEAGVEALKEQARAYVVAAMLNG